MRCLLLHCNKFSYKFHHATPVAEPSDEQESTFQDAMVVFVAAEKSDVDETVEKAATEILNIAQKVEAKQIVINPFAHLTKSLASASKALELTKALVSNLKEKSKLDIVYTSFGWYKSFTLDVYGHNGSQEFREFS
ncbi:hypothetical protein EPN87_03805 [archaeon]|nr:MAG: hypothetical protein EPN87_03805 [archaeon]